MAIQCDVSDEKAVADMVKAVKKEWGRVDILVNNAGITRDGLLMIMKEEDWQAVLNTNLNGAFHCTKAVSRLMMKQRSGSIINITSVVGETGNAGQANYAAAKAGSSASPNPSPRNWHRATSAAMPSLPAASQRI